VVIGLVTKPLCVQYRSSAGGLQGLADEKVRDILHRLSTRSVCGHAVNARVGRRGWERPRVAVSDRLYRLYRVPDPWDPNARKDTTPIGLGPVSLRLGEKRRQPAPHLKPKPAKAKASAKRDPLAGLPKVPRAPRPPAPTPPKVSTAKQSRAAVREEDDARAAEIAERMRAAEAARGGAWRRASTSSSVADEAPAPVLPVRPDIPEVSGGREQTQEVPAPVAASARSSRGSSGRFRMAAKAITNAPVVRTVADPVVESEAADAPVVAAPAPRPRAMPSVGGSMDDFFGAAAQMGRLSMPKREAEPEE
jgi:hypothetical protein